jgi:hypothetical protein
MPYIINKSDGTPLTTLEDGTLDNSTSIGLIGRNYTGYGETQNENFLFLLENFANSNPPARPLEGQTWFNRITKTLYSYNGSSWNPVGAAYVGDVPPAENDGQLWFKATTEQLFVYYDGSWKLIGPEAVLGFGETKWRTSILKDVDNVDRPVTELILDGNIISISTNVDFTINPINPRPGFFNLKAGINLRSDKTYTGSLNGNSSTSTKLETARTINGVAFDGSQNINISSSTRERLIPGNYITGTAFNGSQEVTWNISASSDNILGRLVARDSAGDFSAGTITANLIGGVQGNVNVSTGSSNFNNITANIITAELVGNATSAGKLRTPRLINGVAFDGQGNITVTAAAGTLTGTALASNVLTSSLTELGTLNFLRTGETGVYVGTTDQFRIHIDGSTPTIRITNNQKLKIDLVDTDTTAGRVELSLIPSQDSLSLGGPNQPAFVPDSTGVMNLGHPFAKWNKIYANSFDGYILADDVKGGARGSILYQSNSNSTDKLAIGSTGQILRVGASGLPEWQSAAVGNVGNAVVVRDGTGNFSANTITANLNGNASTSTLAASATKLQTARRINGVLFDGTADINVTGTTPIWAGVTSLGNIIATYSNNVAYPPGFKVAFLQERTINIFTGNGAVFLTEYYRRVVQKINLSNGWTDVGG